MRNGRSTATIQLARRVSAKFTRAVNSLSLLCAALFIAGCAVGALMIAFDDSLFYDFTAEVIKNNLEDKAAGTFISTAAASFIPKVFVALMLYVFSYCAFGAAFIGAILFVYGAGFGLSGGFAYEHFGLKGVIFNLFILLIPTLLSAFGYIRLSVSGIRSSKELFETAFRRSGRGHAALNDELLSASASCLCFIAAASIADGLLCRLFGGIFV